MLSTSKRSPAAKLTPKDYQWIADLLQQGLLRGSFWPPPPIRELRDLTRLRTSLRQDHTAVAKRRQKILEDANLKLASVASDWLGVSGPRYARPTAGGEEDVATRADLARGRLREKIPALQLALHGRLTDHHRWRLRLAVGTIGIPGIPDCKAGRTDLSACHRVPGRYHPVYDDSRH